MRRIVLGAVVTSILASGALLAGVVQVGASEQFEDATRIKCDKCHSKPNKDDRGNDDLTACGKAALKYLEGKGYVSKSIKKGDKNAEKAAARLIKGFKCPAGA